MKSVAKYLASRREPKVFIKQDGFFEAALFGACDVDSRPLGWALNNIGRIISHYDIIVVNSRCRQKTISHDCVQWVGDIELPAVLFCGYDQAHVLPADCILDRFDLIYKREPLRDTDRYEVSDLNCRKLRATMLHCPMIPIEKASPNRLPPFPRPRMAGEPFESDVFFSGSIKTNGDRRVVVDRLSRSPNTFLGGFNDAGPSERRFGKLNRAEFNSAIKRAKINLALDGYGQFTYRHLETWCLGGFCLSTPSIRDVTLPFVDPQEGIHYAAFDDLDDLMEKVDYYLGHEEERQLIAEAGRALFEQLYDPLRHGRDMKDEFERLIEQRNAGGVRQ